MLYDHKRWELNPALAPWQTVLVEAADRIEKDGLCQGKYKDDQGRPCTRGAMTSMHHADIVKAVERLAVVIGTSDITMWNDAPGRTAEEVVYALRKACTDE
jgi:hypothetical protein